MNGNLEIYLGKACRKNSEHIDENSQSYRNIRHGCLKCNSKFEGMTIEEIIEELNKPKAALTLEEIRAKQVIATKKWQEKNRDKTQAYQKKYYHNPEVNAKSKSDYANMDPVVKEQMLERQRIYNKKRYDALTPEQIEKRRADDRRRYQERIAAIRDAK